MRYSTNRIYFWKQNRTETIQTKSVLFISRLIGGYSVNTSFKKRQQHFDTVLMNEIQPSKLTDFVSILLFFVLFLLSVFMIIIIFIMLLLFLFQFNSKDLQSTHPYNLYNFFKSNYSINFKERLVNIRAWLIMGNHKMTLNNYSLFYRKITGFLQRFCLKKLKIKSIEDFLRSTGK